MSKKNAVNGATLTNDNYQPISVYNDSIGYDAFDIRDYLERLEKSPKSKSKYICPVCGGSNLDINLETGAYHCFSGDCNPQDIREAIAPWSESPRNPQNNKQSYRSNYNGSRKPQPKSKPQPAQIPNHVELATFTPKDFPERQGNKTIYKYSETQRVERTDTPKGKKIFPFHSGSGKAGKGSQSWPLYRESEARAHGRGKFVLMAEGEECVERPRSIGLVAVTLQGSDWGAPTIEAAISRLKEASIAGFAYFPDNDRAGLTKAEKIADACAKLGMPCVQVPPESLGITQEKGDIADYIKEKLASGMAPEQIRETLERIFLERASQRRAINQQLTEIVHPQETNSQRKKLPASSVISESLSEQWRGKIAYDLQAALWREYNGIVWSEKHQGSILSAISAYIRANQWECSSAFLSDCERYLRLDLQVCKWEPPASNLINFRNGILNLDANELEPHAPEHRFIDFLDRDYCILEEAEPPLSMLARHAPAFNEILSFATEGKQHRQLRILAAIAGVIRKEFARAQKFLQITGKPGTGKGTLSRFIEKIVGMHNTESSTLRTLCGSNPDYAISKIIHKQLVILPDEETTSKNLGVIKSLTGGDRVDYRAPYSPPASGKFSGTLLILSNESPFAGSTSGLDRRQFLIAMNRQFKKRDPEVEARLERELGAVTSIALSLPIEQVRSLIDSNPDAQISWQQKCEVSPVADWMESSIVFDDAAEIPLKTFTQHYQQWREDNGKETRVPSKFSLYICEYSRDIFGQDISVKRKRNGNVVYGIRLATSSDPMISELLEQECVGCVQEYQKFLHTINFSDSNGCSDSVQEMQEFGQNFFPQEISLEPCARSNPAPPESTSTEAQNPENIKCTKKVNSSAIVSDVPRTIQPKATPARSHLRWYEKAPKDDRLPLIEQARELAKSISQEQLDRLIANIYGKTIAIEQLTKLTLEVLIDDLIDQLKR